MRIAIVGNGISGITAARHLRKLDDACEITVISSESKHFYSRTALMYIYMGHMKFEHTKPYEDHFWKKNRISLVQDFVEKLDLENKALQLEEGGSFSFDKLLLATGSKSNRFNWPGQELSGVQSLYSIQDLELLEENTHKFNASAKERKVQHAVVVGGGLIGVELAEMLISRGIQVTFLIRESRFWGNVLPEEEGLFIQEHIRSHHVELLTNTELKEIKGENNRVSSIVTTDGREISCEFVGLTVGVSPNIDFLKDSNLALNRGILVERNLSTSAKDVYAAGDCVEFRNPPEGRKSVEQVWYTGRMMGEVVASNMLGGNKEYNPGPWFNSAKFFDIEYQTYGMVESRPKDGEKSFFWRNDESCIKIVFAENGQVRGVNVFGIRLKHAFMDELLRRGESVDYLLEHWDKVLFDPEFFANHGEEIIKAFNTENNTNIKWKNTSWIARLMS